MQHWRTINALRKLSFVELGSSQVLFRASLTSESEKSASNTEDEINQLQEKKETKFPDKSPLLASDSTQNARELRNKFLRELISKSDSVRQSRAGDRGKDSIDEKEKDLLDPDTGFAELGGFKNEMSTGLLDEQPIKLHPTRLFYPGDVYEPEELHPLGAVSRGGRPTRRTRQPIILHQEQELKEKLSFKNLLLMNNYLSDAGLILPRRITRLSSGLQKKLSRSVKLAQALALLPVLDRRPEFRGRPRRNVSNLISRETISTNVS